MTEVTLSNGQTITLHCNMSVMLKREKALLNPEVKQNGILLSALVILAMAQAADPATTLTVDDILNIDSFADFNTLDKAALAEFQRLMGTADPVPSASPEDSAPVPSASAGGEEDPAGAGKP